MHLKRRLASERLRRIRERAEAAGKRVEVRVAPAKRPAVSIGSVLCGSWADKPDGRRSNARVPVAGDACVRRAGRFGFQLPLRDVSVAGCMVELVEAVHAEDRVIARLPGLEPFGARVAWASRYTASLHFDRPMHPAVFELLITRLA